MLSSLDITKLLAETKNSLVGGAVTAVEYYRKERIVQLIVKADRRLCLTLSFHPQRSGLFILPANRSQLPTREKYRPFARPAWSGTILTIEQISNDRIIEIAVERDAHRYMLILEVLGPNGDMLLLDERRRPVESIRKRKSGVADAYQPPPLPEKLDPASVTAEQLEKLFILSPGANPARLLEKHIYGLDYYLGGHLIAGDASFEEMAERLRDLCGAYAAAEGPVHAYRFKGKTHLYPIRLSGLEPLEKYPSLSLAQREGVIETKAEDDAAIFRERTLKAVKARLKKARRLYDRLAADIEEAADYERYLQFADLLKIHLAGLKRGMAVLTVDNLYAPDTTVDIPLDPKLTGPENIEAYSRRYRKGREGLDLLTRRRENTGREIESLVEILELFESDFEQARNQYPEMLPDISGAGHGETVTRKPYKEYRTSTGVTVLVGKTGDDNDRTTFDYAKPYELWFHASQCPGSHVILKFPHKKFEPSRGEIEEAAAAAAWASKARNSAKVPVSYTYRKYVRKPRRAKPGLVSIERETTILVEPRELSKPEN